MHLVGHVAHPDAQVKVSPCPLGLSLIPAW